jgi:hypothetical protein
VHDQIYKLRRQYSELEKRAICVSDEFGSKETIEKGKINILIEIEKLQLTIKSL